MFRPALADGPCAPAGPCSASKEFALVTMFARNFDADSAMPAVFIDFAYVFHADSGIPAVVFDSRISMAFRFRCRFDSTLPLSVGFRFRFRIESGFRFNGAIDFDSNRIISSLA